MSNQHDIRTIEDLLNVVSDKNIASFLSDFTTWLQLRVALKEQIKSKLHPDDAKIMLEPIFRWVDDGKSNIEMRIKIKQTDKSIESDEHNDS